MHSAGPEALTPPGVAFGPALTAPAHWCNIDFISDLHLQATEPATFECWRNFMLTTPADAVFILGDLFEVWVGDDVVDAGLRFKDQPNSFEAQCGQVLQQASQRLAVYFMHGNRDFLLGPAFAQACGMTLLRDPTVLDFADARWLLTHGDALCLADTEYMKFRAVVRSPQWQSDFLSQPLVKRQATARALRAQSENRKHSGAPYADLDTPACYAWLEGAQATTLIHGHTHQPADHDLAGGLKRITLSDWDAAASPPRAQILRLIAPQPGSGETRGTVMRLPAQRLKV